MHPLPEFHSNINSNIRNLDLSNLKNTNEKTVIRNFYNTAHLFIFLADLAYQESNLIEWQLQVNENDRANKTFIYFDDRIRTQGFIIREERADAINIIVVFRGTEYEKLRGSFDDWRNDFLSCLKPLPDVPATEFAKDAVKVHQGFLENVNAVWKKDALEHIFNSLITEQKRSNKSIKIWFTGHSLGGSLATLAAARWAQHFGKQTIGGVYTFGAPACGNDAFVKYYNNNLDLCDITFRFINNRDILARGMTLINYLDPINIGIHTGRNIVKNIPFINTFFPSVPSTNYTENIGGLYYFDVDGKLICNTNGKIADSISWIPKVHLSTLNILELVLDHDHRKYLAIIKKLSENNENLFFNYVGYENSNCNLM